MSATDTVFAGSIPENYDRYMVPLLFRPYAELAAGKAAAWGSRRVLETAAGTGIVTEALHAALPEAEIVATDLNPPMLEVAARRVASPNVRFQAADAQALPFPDASFDLVICQFGLMFFPDKVAGNAEARRVLREDGRYLLIIWDALERNLATRESSMAVSGLFPADAAKFYDRIPFRYFDRMQIEQDLRAAGFDRIEFETVELRSRARSARDAATGLVQGTPVRSEIEALDSSLLEHATDVATQALRQFEAADGFDAPMSAHIVVATK